MLSSMARILGRARCVADDVPNNDAMIGKI